MKRNWKAFQAMLCGILLLLNTPLSVYAAEDLEQIHFEAYVSGDTPEQSADEKTEKEYIVIEIGNQEELEAFAESCRVDAWSEDKKAVLTADIALKENTELIIPSFGGIFEGGGYQITNLHISSPGSAVGLFRYLRKGGRIQNLHVEGTVAPGGSKSETGGIVGRNYGIITDCSFQGSVSADTASGGIAGKNAEGGVIKNTVNRARVTGNHFTGGIAGENQGEIYHCTNEGGINTDGSESSSSLETLAEISADGLQEINSAENFNAHTDTGGIAGLSSGKIFYCKNSGNVGYQHLGYNVGGIAGRLSQGYIQNCTNTGTVLGRKDVGGIAGQMEPFLELLYRTDHLTRLGQETDVMLDMLSGSRKNLSGYGKQASETARGLTENLKNLSAAVGNLNQTGNHLWYLYNQELQGISNDVNSLKGDLGGGSPDLPSVSGGDASAGAGQVWNEIEAAKAALGKFTDSTTGHINTMTSAARGGLETLHTNLNVMNREMQAACEGLERLIVIADNAGNTTDQDMAAIEKQARVLADDMKEIRNDLFAYDGISFTEASDEEAAGAAADEQERIGAEGWEEQQTQYDTDSFRKGKITRCINQGRIEADTNTGGIAGQISTELDFDPEDDIKLTGKESFEVEQTVKAVIRESRNEGEIISKKDNTGGIVGKADFGAVISCEAYGKVSGSSGSNVGGIAGASGYALRSCYFSGEVSGKNNVGGIAGTGTDIFFCIVNARPLAEGEGIGSIAGNLAEDGILSHNYYLDNTAGGVDGIAYRQGAEPLSYEEFRTLPGLPEEFQSFTVTFTADDIELASVSCAYGEILSEEQLPEIPEKEGFYGEWSGWDKPVTENIVLEAGYEKWVSSLALEETGQNGASTLLVEGKFYAEDYLTLEREKDVYSIEVRGERPEKRSPVTVHLQAEDQWKKPVVEVLAEEEYHQVTSQMLGSYLVFTMEEPGTFRIVEKKASYSTVLLYIGGAIGFGGLALALKRRRRSQSGRRS